MVMRFFRGSFFQRGNIFDGQIVGLYASVAESNQEWHPADKSFGKRRRALPCVGRIPGCVPFQHDLAVATTMRARVVMCGEAIAPMVERVAGHAVIFGGVLGKGEVGRAKDESEEEGTGEPFGGGGHNAILLVRTRL